MVFLEIAAKLFYYLSFVAYWFGVGVLWLLVIISIVYYLCNFKQLSAEAAKAANDIKEGWPFYLILFIFCIVGPSICALYEILK